MALFFYVTSKLGLGDSLNNQLIFAKVFSDLFLNLQSKFSNLGK